MSWQDLINGIFELSGGLFILLHCTKLYYDKKVRGVSIAAILLFTLWGIWNLYYYPHLNQWMSFIGGLGTVSANILYMVMLVHYINREIRLRRNLLREVNKTISLHPMDRCTIKEAHFESERKIGTADKGNPVS